LFGAAAAAAGSAALWVFVPRTPERLSL